jgi:hypothetical protein
MRRTSRLDQSQHDNAPVARVRARVERRAYSVNDYCRAMSIARSTAYSLMREGSLPYFIIGGRRHISADVVEAQCRGEFPGQRRPNPTRRCKDGAT